MRPEKKLKYPKRVQEAIGALKIDTEKEPIRAFYVFEDKVVIDTKKKRYVYPPKKEQK